MNGVIKLASIASCLGALLALSAGSAFAGSTSDYGEGGEVTFAGDTQDAVHSFTNVGANTFTLSREAEVRFLVVGGGGANNIASDYEGRPGGRGVVIIRVKQQAGFVIFIR